MKPVVTLASAAAAVGIAVALWPFVPKFQTAEAAELHAKEDRREATEIRYAIAQQEVLTLRNRVNDCTVAASKTRSLHPTESAVCQQYRDEYKESAKRAQVLYEKTVKP